LEDSVAEEEKDVEVLGLLRLEEADLFEGWEEED
jgi:hypothetical protein